MKNMNDQENGLSEIRNVFEGVITGIPTPVRKNFFKAFGQLCTAAVDVPVAWLESRSAEIRAVTDARMQIIQKEGEIISKQIEVPKDLILKASLKYAGKVIREQTNLDDITLNSAKELSVNASTTVQNEEVKDISEDWLNEFENMARLKSSDDMKLVFGKILAGEIVSPGSFSIKTVKIISQLDNEPAKIFQLLCSLAVSLRFSGRLHDARVIAFDKSAAHNSLREYGLSFAGLNILQEYGLIIADYNSNFPYVHSVSFDGNKSSALIRFQNKDYMLVPIGGVPLDVDSYKFSGVELSNAGKELLDIIPLLSFEEAEHYRNSLFKYFESKSLKLVEVVAD